MNGSSRRVRGYNIDDDDSIETECAKPAMLRNLKFADIHHFGCGESNFQLPFPAKLLIGHQF